MFAGLAILNVTQHKEENLTLKEKQRHFFFYLSGCAWMLPQNIMEPVIPIFQVLDVFTRRMCECSLSLFLLFVFVCMFDWNSS